MIIVFRLNFCVVLNAYKFCNAKDLFDFPLMEKELTKPDNYNYYNLSKCFEKIL